MMSSPTAAVHMRRREKLSHHMRHSAVTHVSLVGTLPPGPRLERDPGSSRTRRGDTDKVRWWRFKGGEIKQRETPRKYSTIPD